MPEQPREPILVQVWEGFFGREISRRPQGSKAWGDEDGANPTEFTEPMSKMGQEKLCQA